MRKFLILGLLALSLFGNLYAEEKDSTVAVTQTLLLGYGSGHQYLEDRNADFFTNTEALATTVAFWGGMSTLGGTLYAFNNYNQLDVVGSGIGNVLIWGGLILCGGGFGTLGVLRVWEDINLIRIIQNNDNRSGNQFEFIKEQQASPINDTFWLGFGSGHRKLGDKRADFLLISEAACVTIGMSSLLLLFSNSSFGVNTGINVFAGSVGSFILIRGYEMVDIFFAVNRDHNQEIKEMTLVPELGLVPAKESGVRPSFNLKMSLY